MEACVENLQDNLFLHTEFALIIVSQTCCDERRAWNYNSTTTHTVNSNIDFEYDIYKLLLWPSASRKCSSAFVRLQIGRSTESPIDFVVTDTSGGGKEGEDPSIAPSTISRFACRVVCERNPPYTARIYAAGFDSSKNIFLGVSKAKIQPTKVLLLKSEVQNTDLMPVFKALS